MAFNGNKWKQLNYLISLHENLQGFERWVSAKSFNFVQKKLQLVRNKHYKFNKRKGLWLWHRAFQLTAAKQ